MTGRLLAASFSLLLASCHYGFFSNLVIKNGAATKVSGVVLIVKDKSYPVRDLEPGQSTIFHEHLPGEGAPVIAYTIQGRRLSGEGCYFTGGMPPRGEVILTERGIVTRC